MNAINAVPGNGTTTRRSQAILCGLRQERDSITSRAEVQRHGRIKTVWSSLEPERRQYIEQYGSNAPTLPNHLQPNHWRTCPRCHADRTV